MLLEVDKLHTFYGSVHALKGLSFSIEPGQIVSLIGSNGAGKSTTLKAISSLIRSRQGTIKFEDKDITNASSESIVAKGIVHVPEGRRIFVSLTVHENLLMGAFLRRDKAEIAKDLEYVYELFPRLKERSQQLGGTLSGGEQQMLAIGRAIMTKPKLLMLDEPSMGLAPIVVQEIFTRIQELKKKGLTILLVEQNANLALRVSDKAYVIETGEIVLSGTGSELLADDRVRKAYLGEN